MGRGKSIFPRTGILNIQNYHLWTHTHCKNDQFSENVFFTYIVEPLPGHLIIGLHV